MSQWYPGCTPPILPADHMNDGDGSMKHRTECFHITGPNGEDIWVDADSVNWLREIIEDAERDVRNWPDGLARRGSVTDPAEIIATAKFCAQGRIGLVAAQRAVKALTEANFAIADLSTHVIVPRDLSEADRQKFNLVGNWHPDERSTFQLWRDLAKFMSQRAMINHKDNADGPRMYVNRRAIDMD